MRISAPHSLSWIVTLWLLPVSVFALQVNSPDTRISVTVDIDGDGAPRYSVLYRGKTVINSSRLGMRFAKHRGLESGLRIVKSERSSDDNVWRQPWGERRRIRDHYNELFILFSANSPERQVGLRVRVHNDGIGFRYEVPDQRYYKDVEIVDELTEFNVPQDAVAWWIPGPNWHRYESLFHKSPVGQVLSAHTPMTIRLPNGTHISIHEAALVDYAAFVLERRRNGFRTSLAPWSDGIKVKTRAPFNTPWRTIQVAPFCVGRDLDRSIPRGERSRSRPTQKGCSIPI